MKPRTGILAEIIIILALVLAVPAKAEGIFTLRIGYNDYPYYGGYYNYWADHSWYGYWPSFYSPAFIGNYFPYYYFFYPSYYYSYFYYRPVFPYSHAYWCSPWNYCPYYSQYRYDHYGHHHHQRRDHKSSHDRHNSHDRHYSHDRHNSHDRHASREPYRNYDQYRQQRSFQQESATTGRTRPYRSHTDDGRTPVTIFRNSQAAGREAGNLAFNNSGRDKPDVRPGDKKINILTRQQSRQAPMVTSPSVRGTTRVLRSTNHTAIPSHTIPARKRNYTVVQPAAPGRGPAHTRQPPLQQSYVSKLPRNKQSSSGRPVKNTAAVHPQQQPQVQSGRRTDYAQAQSGPRQYRGRDNRQPAAGNTGKDSRRTHKQRGSRE